MATKARKKSSAGKKRGVSVSNYLLVGSDGKLLLRSGSTGKIRALNDAELKKVLPLLKKRQQLGLELAKVLQTEDFPLADAEIIDCPPGG
jgi:hypothetical protein